MALVVFGVVLAGCGGGTDAAETIAETVAEEKFTTRWARRLTIPPML